MPKRHPPLTPREVQGIVKALGFVFDRQESSHEHYVGEIAGQRRVVTIDLNVDEFAPDLIKSMIRQSGVDREAFYCATKDTAKKIGRRKT